MKSTYFGKRREETPIVCYSGFDRNLKPGITWGPVTRDVYIFECNTAGYGSAIINGREFPVRPGDCYILLPGDTIIHTTSAHNPRRGAWCAADGMQIGWALAQAGISSDNPYAPPELFDELSTHLHAIAQMHDETDPGAELRRRGHLYSFLGILLKNAQSPARADWLPHVIGYMDTHYNEQISVSDLAATAHLERSYFSVRFKEETGATPHMYLTSLRIRKACELMSKMRCSISETAELVGLDARNFSRIFSRETGMTPKQYLKKLSE